MMRSSNSALPQAVSIDWHQSPEGEGALAHVTDPQTGARRQYGLLERPLLPPTAQNVAFKLFLAGKSGVGKTSLVSILAGSGNSGGNALQAGETPGVRVTNVFWPTSIRAQIVLFQLSLWDAGEVACKKYGHILPVSRDGAAGGIFVFSYADRNSFEEVGNQLARLSTHPESSICPIVVGTRFGALTEAEVTQQDIAQFETKWKRPVLKVRSFPSAAGQQQQQNGLSRFPSPSEVALILNIICDRLWCHLQQQQQRSLEPALI